MDTKQSNATEADPHGLDQHAPGAKLDAGKVRPWLMISGFSRALQAVAVVTTKGAEKYTPDGWAQVENGQERYLEAMGRHMLALGTGEKYDAETGCMHLSQVIWNALASLELELRKAEAFASVPLPHLPPEIFYPQQDSFEVWKKQVRPAWCSTADVAGQDTV